MQDMHCRVCGGGGLEVFFELPQVPTHCNVLWPTREEALQAPRGDIRLAFCPACGHVYNVAFNPALMSYSQAYENSLHFSPRFQRYAEGLAARLVERYDLRGKDIVEIGSGKGDFLRMLCEQGGNRGVGFDPSHDPDLLQDAPPEGLRFVQDFYSARYADYQADLICSRHVLEHIEQPRAFIQDVRHAVGDRPHTTVYFEVPNVLYTLRDMGIWDVIYEHCSYFSASSLGRLFTACGFDVLCLEEAYGGQFLGIEAVPAQAEAGTQQAPGNDLREMARDVAAFAENYRGKVSLWRRRLSQIGGAGRRAVIWGAGSKGVTFLNTLRAGDTVTHVVDINPRKQGRYVAGTGQRIVPPEFLRSERPDVVLVMNPLYLDEIRQTLATLGLTPEVLCV